MTPVTFTLNGQQVTYQGDPTARLLDVLRDEFSCTSVKCGCKEGECGACSVLINGVLMNSCCVAAGSIAGAEVMSMEGYRATKRYQVLSDAWAEFAAVQCGFCIPGMVLASEALLDGNPHPTEEEIREGLSGNLCRCTGYNAIVKGVKLAAERGEGVW